MKILLVSATEKEINLLLQQSGSLSKTGPGMYSGKFNSLPVDFLITGVGLPSTIFNLTKTLLSNSYKLVINVGIAGAFPCTVTVGTVVNIISESFGDLGVDNRGEFQTIFEMGFHDKNNPPFQNGKLVNRFIYEKIPSLSTLPKVSGITVNKASGDDEDILKKIAKFQPEVESMEGAGVFYVCQQLGVPYIEIRAISNLVESRDVKKWNIPLALTNLNTQVSLLLSELEKTL